MDYPKSVPNVGLVNGKFVDENTATGQVGSLIPASWGNSVTQEILTVITAASLVPSEANTGQLLEAIRAFVNFTTAPKFDSDTSVATTEFVQRALGNFAGQYSVTSTQTLTLAQAGLIINAGNTITLTLPTATALNIGATYQINNAGIGEVTVQASADQMLYSVGNGTPRAFVLRSGDTVTISYVGGKSWYAWGGVQLGASASFAAVFSGAGYQVLPSGELEQSGTVTLTPIGNYNAQILGGVTYYTNYYEITYPLAFTAGPYTANVTLACGTVTSQGSMAGCNATCNMSGGLTKLYVAVTTPSLGFTPTIHWKVRGKI